METVVLARFLRCAHCDSQGFDPACRFVRRLATLAVSLHGRGGIRTSVGRARYAARALPGSGIPCAALSVSLSLDTIAGAAGFEPAIERLGTSRPVP